MARQLEAFGDSFGKLGVHLKNAQQSFVEADKRFEKASNTLETLLTATEALPALADDGATAGAASISTPAAIPGITPAPKHGFVENTQGTLLMPPSSAKKSA